MRIDKLSGLFNCVSCGYSGDIFSLFGINKEKFIGLKAEALKEKIDNILSNKSIAIPLDAVEYNGSFRGISNDTLRKFSAFTTDSIKGMEDRIVFPLYDYMGRTIGFQGRYIHSDLNPKYKMYPAGINMPLYPSDVKPINDSIILVEGILDMINMHDKGLYNTMYIWNSFWICKKEK